MFRPGAGRMSYLEVLHTAHKERRQKLWPAAPKTMRPAANLLTGEGNKLSLKESVILEKRRLWREAREKWERQKRAVEAKQKEFTPVKIIQIVAEQFNVPANGIMRECRLKSLTRPRFMAMALVQQFYDFSYKKIGEQFGGRDHTTIIHSVRRAKAISLADVDYAMIFAECERLCMEARDAAQ